MPLLIINLLTYIKGIFMKNKEQKLASIEIEPLMKIENLLENIELFTSINLENSIVKVNNSFFINVNPENSIEVNNSFFTNINSENSIVEAVNRLFTNINPEDSIVVEANNSFFTNFYNTAAYCFNYALEIMTPLAVLATEVK